MLGRRAALAVGAGVLLAGSIVLSLPNPAVAARVNDLLNPAVSPTSGTTKTTFTFSVRYRSSQGNKPTSVSAVAGSTVIPLALVSGSPADGRYRGTAKLPAGRWDVAFQATAHGNDPSVDGPTVVVSAAPQPTRPPRPTPRPTPKPTARPTAAATQAPPPPSSALQTTEPRTPRPATEEPSRRPGRTPEATSTASETQPVGGGTATRTPRPTDEPGASGGGLGPSPLITVLTGTVIALGVLAILGMFVIVAARRRRPRDTRLELLPDEARDAPAAPATGKAGRQPTSWERDWALDEAPIGSVEYRPPPLNAEPAPDEDGP